MDHQHRIDLRCLQDHTQGRAIALGIRVRTEIDRARKGGDLAHRRGDGGMDRRRRANQGAATGQERIGRQLGRPMAVGEQRQAAPAQTVTAPRRAWAKAGGGREQLLDRLYPDQAGPSEGRIIDVVAVQAHAAAGPLGGRADLPPGLEDEHRLDARSGAGGRHEAPGVGDALEVDQHRPGREVERQIVQDVAELDLRMLPQGRDA